MGSFRDPEAVRAFAEGVDVLTVEIEHVDAEAVQQVGRSPCNLNIMLITTLKTGIQPVL